MIMGFQLKPTFCSKMFATGPSKLINVVRQMENQTKTKVIIFSRSILAIKTEPNLKLYGETLKVYMIYPQVNILGITFDSQLDFKKHFEDILDRCNTRYHRLRLPGLIMKCAITAQSAQTAQLHLGNNNTLAQL